MSRKIYVGNLPSTATEAKLSAKLAAHGNVSGVKLMTDRRTGRSLGYAFVEMATTADAALVIEKLDGEVYDGWKITVRTATPNRT